MNELIFFLHIFIIMSAVIGALLFSSHALVALVAISGILANIFVVKQITLFGLDVTASDAYIIAGMLSLNLIQEYYGKQLARKTIWLSFASMLFYLFISQLHLMFIPSVHDSAHHHFISLLSPMPRIIGASVFVYFIAQRFDYHLYGFLSRVLSRKYLVLRNTLSLICSQALDTILFSFLGLYGIVGSIWHVIFFSFFMKCCVIASSIPFIALSKWLMNRLGRPLSFDGARKTMFHEKRRQKSSVRPELVEGYERLFSKKNHLD